VGSNRRRTGRRRPSEARHTRFSKVRSAILQVAAQLDDGSRRRPGKWWPLAGFPMRSAHLMDTARATKAGCRAPSSRPSQRAAPNGGEQFIAGLGGRIRNFLHAKLMRLRHTAESPHRRNFCEARTVTLCVHSLHGPARRLICDEAASNDDRLPPANRSVPEAFTRMATLGMRLAHAKDTDTLADIRAQAWQPSCTDVTH
jgi:hypothetical protein